MTLLGFARFYEGIYGMMPSDKPDESVIENDEALDRWYDAYLRNLAVQAGKRAGGGRNVPVSPDAIPTFTPGGK